MENYEENLDEQFTSLSPLYLKPETFKDCKSIANWAMFFSILGFVLTGLTIIIGIILVFAAGLFGAEEFGRSVGLFFLVLVAIYLLPLVYLFKFSREMSKAIRLKNNDFFNAALSKLKTHFLIVGVLTILFMVSYFLFWGYVSSLGIGSLLNSGF